MPVPTADANARTIAEKDLPKPGFRAFNGASFACAPLVMDQAQSLLSRLGDISASSHQMLLRADVSGPDNPLASTSVGVLADRGRRDLIELDRLPLTDFLLALPAGETVLIVSAHWREAKRTVVLAAEADGIESGAAVRPLGRFACTPSGTPEVELLHDGEPDPGSPMATVPDDVRIATALRGLYATVGLWAERSDLLVPHDGRAIHVDAGSRRIERVAVRERSMIVRRRTGPATPAEATAYPRGRLPLVGTRRAARRVDRSGRSSYQPECLTGVPSKSAHLAFFRTVPRFYLAG
jgi:hypothetical protein